MPSTPPPVRTVSAAEFWEDPDKVIDFAYSEGKVVVEEDISGVRMTFSTQTEEVDLEL